MGWLPLPLDAQCRCGGHASKSGQDLGLYFSEVAAAALTLREKSFVLDGELVVPVSGRFSFDNLLQRIHPATSRIKKLSEQTPALFLAFDLLRRAGLSLRPRLYDNDAFRSKTSQPVAFQARASFDFRLPAKS